MFNKEKKWFSPVKWYGKDKELQYLLKRFFDLKVLIGKRTWDSACHQFVKNNGLYMPGNLRKNAHVIPPANLSRLNFIIDIFTED